MKEEIIKIAEDLKQGTITETKAQNLLLGLFGVSKSVCCKCNSDYILLQGNYNECGKCGYVW